MLQPNDVIKLKYRLSPPKVMKVLGPYGMAAQLGAEVIGNPEYELMDLKTKETYILSIYDIRILIDTPTKEEKVLYSVIIPDFSKYPGFQVTK